MRQNGFVLQHSSGGIILPSARHNEQQVRDYAVESEREYGQTDCDHLTDNRVWKRVYGQGFRVVPIVVSTVSRPNREAP